MAESEEGYLRQCLEKNICPACQRTITEKFGSGQSKDGVFCSLGCYGEWHKGSLWLRHKERLKKGPSNE